MLGDVDGMLGVSGSVVRQVLRRLEGRLGVALVQRTTRSVRLTEAGERLYAAPARARRPLSCPGGGR